MSIEWNEKTGGKMYVADEKNDETNRAVVLKNSGTSVLMDFILRFVPW